MEPREKLRELMQARGWSLYRLAKESGVSWSTIRNMFERNTEPTVPTLEAICNGLGITLAELLLGDGSMELSEEQRELIAKWNALRDSDQQIILELVRSLDRKERCRMAGERTLLRLRQLLNERGWTEYRLAKESGLSESTIANIYRPTPCRPSLRWRPFAGR